MERGIDAIGLGRFYKGGESIDPHSHLTLWGMFDMDEDEDDRESVLWVDPNCHKCDTRLEWFDRNTWLCPVCDFTEDDDE